MTKHFKESKLLEMGEKSPDPWFISVSYLSGLVTRLKIVRKPKQFQA